MSTLPAIFKPLLWSYNFDACDPITMKKTIIIQALSYGTLEHWRWIRSFYGDEAIRAVLMSIPATAIKNKTKPLIETVFRFSNWNYAPRGTRQ